MQDKEGKEDGPGEDTTLLGGRRTEENPEKVSGGDMPMPVWDIPRNAKGWFLRLLSSYPLILCLASFAADTYNSAYFFNDGDIVFGSLTLFCLLVPGYFGKRHLLKNKEFVSTELRISRGCCTRLKATFLYVFCMATFPIFNVVFKAMRLFQATTASSDSFALEMDRVKSLFEDSPQLALQLYICFKSEPQIVQILAIILSSLTVALPNLRSLKEMNFLSRIAWDWEFAWNWESRKQSLKSIGEHVCVFSVFVIVSFTRAASIAIIFCFLSYNAILVYSVTFLALRIVFELAKLAVEHKALVKISKEGTGDILANAFNIFKLNSNSFVTKTYAVFWMIFNLATIGLILAHEKYGVVSNDTMPLVSSKISSSPLVSSNASAIPINLWIAPTIQLTDWSEIFISKQGVHVKLSLSLCLLNVFSCIIICVLTTMINKPKEKKQECETYKHEDVVKRAAGATQQEAIHNSQQKSDKVQKKDDEVSTENVEEMEAKIPETKDSVPDDVAKQIWAPYNNSRHYETVQKEKSDNKTGLSTMTQLMDPWDFVSDYVNNLLKKKKKEGVSARIDPFKYEDPQQLLLKIMHESVKFMSDDPIFVELFERCKRQYDFLKQLEKESMGERFEELEERFEELGENEFILPHK